MKTDKQPDRPIPAAAVTGNTFAPAHSSLLKRFSIVTLLTMLAAAALLSYAYRQDQLAEYERAVTQENEKTVIHLTHLFGEQMGSFVMDAGKLDVGSLRENPDIGTIAALAGTIGDHSILKLKLYSPSGLAVFSSVPDDIGGVSKNRAMLEQALAGRVRHNLEFRNVFRAPAGELFNRHIVSTYAPLSHAGKIVGVLEIYSDFTPNIRRIHTKIAWIALLVFCFFGALYAALFLFARRTDRDIAGWQETIAGNAAKLAESETRLRMTIDAALDAIISIDEEGRLIAFNPAAENIFGWKRKEAVGHPMADLLMPPRYRSDHRHGMARYLRTGEAHILNRRIETTALRHDGSEFQIELAVTPIREGDHVIFTAYARDITEQKRAERELAESRRQLQELAVFQQTALEDERKRIARELHDELGQVMTALRFDLNWLRENVNTQEGGIGGKISAMNAMLGQTVDSIRRISEDLRPGMLDDLGLAAAVEHYAAKFSERTGIACELFVNWQNFDLDDRIATALFRIVQESLTNVARHSGASRVTIRLHGLKDHVLLIVQDNGRGFLLGRDAGKKTYGLHGMRERVAMLGGTLDIFTEPGSGARIEANIPVSGMEGVQ